MTDRTPSAIDAAVRRAESLVMSTMADAGQRSVAEQMGISETTLSEMKNSDKLAKYLRLFVVLDFKLVPTSEVTFDPSIIGALKTFAVLGLAHVDAQVAEVGA